MEAGPSGVANPEKGLALLADLEQAGALTSIGLKLTDPNLSYETYAAVGLLLGKVREAIQWAIGDYILIGEQLFKERSYQAISEIGVSESGLREYVRVAERVPRSIRRPELSWSHHRAVAALPPPEQKTWLSRAADERMSHHALRDALRNGAEPAASTTCRCCGRALDA